MNDMAGHVQDREMGHEIETAIQTAIEIGRRGGIGADRGKEMTSATQMVTAAAPETEMDEDGEMETEDSETGR